VSPPGYELTEEIGRGGMGVVYCARDTALARDVAVKLLSERYRPDSVPAQRFLSEARITGQLQHPGIPAVHQVGTLADGRPFLAMKLIGVRAGGSAGGRGGGGRVARGGGRTGAEGGAGAGAGRRGTGERPSAASERRKRRRLVLGAAAVLALAVVGGLAAVLAVQKRANADLAERNAAVIAIEFAPEGKRLVTQSGGKARVFDLTGPTAATPGLVTPHNTHSKDGHILSMLQFADGDRLW
jgi:hypothetical protein